MIVSKTIYINAIFYNTFVSKSATIEYNFTRKNRKTAKNILNRLDFAICIFVTSIFTVGIFPSTIYIYNFYKQKSKN